MAGRRKRWATQPPLMSMWRRVQPSKTAAYRNVQGWAEQYRAGELTPRIEAIRVLVDEGAGRGWEIYEVIKLADLANIRETRKGD